MQETKIEIERDWMMFKFLGKCLCVCVCIRHWLKLLILHRVFFIVKNFFRSIKMERNANVYSTTELNDSTTQNLYSMMIISEILVCINYNRWFLMMLMWVRVVSRVRSHQHLVMEFHKTKKKSIPIHHVFFWMMMMRRRRRIMRSRIYS